MPTRDIPTIQKEEEEYETRKEYHVFAASSVLAFVGTLAITTPTCLGWFYEPKKPKEFSSIGFAVDNLKTTPE